MEMPNGMFGENFTTEGLMEAEVNVGDVFRIGSSKVQLNLECHVINWVLNSDVWTSSKSF
jgi:MOSC domain-containing protein YiiM